MTVSETFEQFLSGLELDKSYQEIVEDRHAAVRDYLESRLPGVRTQLIGSLQRRTRIDPLTGLQDFDIDILVELFSFERWALPGQGFTGEDALARVEGAVKDGVRYRMFGEPGNGQPCVVCSKPLTRDEMMVGLESSTRFAGSSMIAVGARISCSGRQTMAIFSTVSRWRRPTTGTPC